MEEGDKNAGASKMIGTSATSQTETAATSQTETAATSSKKRRRVGVDAAMDNSSTLPLPLDSSPNITPKKRKEGPSQTSPAETPTPTKRGRGRPPGSGSGSGSKKRKEGPSETTSGTSGENFTPHVIVLTAGEDVVDALYNLCVASYPKTVTILSGSGLVSEIVELTPNGPKHSKGKFEMFFLGIKCPVGNNGHHCRKNAMCTVTYSDDQGTLFGKPSVNSLIAAGPVRIIAGLFTEGTTKKTCARTVDFTAAPRSDGINPIAAIPLQMVREISGPAKEEGSTSGFLQTTSASNDHQDMKSPSVGDNCQDMKSPSVGDT